MEGRKARLKLRFTFTLLKNVSENVVESRKGWEEISLSSFYCMR